MFQIACIWTEILNWKLDFAPRGMRIRAPARGAEIKISILARTRCMVDSRFRIRNRNIIVTAHTKEIWSITWIDKYSNLMQTGILLYLGGNDSERDRQRWLLLYDRSLSLAGVGVKKVRVVWLIDGYRLRLCSSSLPLNVREKVNYSKQFHCWNCTITEDADCNSIQLIYFYCHCCYMYCSVYLR